MTTPDQHAHVAGSWMTTAAGAAYSAWSWLVGDASGLSTLIGLASLALAVIKIAQEIQAWRARDEQRQALRKLWGRMSGRRTRPARLDQ